MLPTTDATTAPTNNRRDTRAERIAANGGQVPVIPRDEFLSTFGSTYAPGQHVTMIGPTQRGKTTLCFQMLDRIISPEFPCVILAGKPDGRDHTMEKAPEILNLRRIKAWPPERTWKDRKRNGYVLRPLGKASQEPEAEEETLKKEFGKALRSLYASKKPVIAVIDETSLIYEDLKLRKEYEAPLKRGAPIVSVWSLLQRGRFITYHAYNAPEHVFIFFDPDRSNRKRYAEIGGVDPLWLEYLLEGLDMKTVESGPGKGMTVSQALYIRRSGPEIVIVDYQ